MPNVNGYDEITLLLPTRRQSLKIQVPKGTSLSKIKRIKSSIAESLGEANASFKINGADPKDEDLVEIERVFAEEGVAVRVDGGFVDDDAPLPNGAMVAAARDQKGGW